MGRPEDEDSYSEDSSAAVDVVDLFGPADKATAGNMGEVPGLFARPGPHVREDPVPPGSPMNICEEVEWLNVSRREGDDFFVPEPGFEDLFASDSWENDDYHSQSSTPPPLHSNDVRYPSPCRCEYAEELFQPGVYQPRTARLRYQPYAHYNCAGSPPPSPTQPIDIPWRVRATDALRHNAEMHALNGNQTRGPRKCYNCGAFGHIAAACPTPKTDAKTCNKCGKLGHIGRNCRTAPPSNTTLIARSLAETSAQVGGQGVAVEQAIQDIIVGIEEGAKTITEEANAQIQGLFTEMSEMLKENTNEFERMDKKLRGILDAAQAIPGLAYLEDFKIRDVYKTTMFLMFDPEQPLQCCWMSNHKKVVEDLSAYAAEVTKAEKRAHASARRAATAATAVPGCSIFETLHSLFNTFFAPAGTREFFNPFRMTISWLRLFKEPKLKLLFSSFFRVKHPLDYFVWVQSLFDGIDSYDFEAWSELIESLTGAADALTKAFSGAEVEMSHRGYTYYTFPTWPVYDTKNVDADGLHPILKNVPQIITSTVAVDNRPTPVAVGRMRLRTVSLQAVERTRPGFKKLTQWDPQDFHPRNILYRLRHHGTVWPLIPVTDTGYFQRQKLADVLSPCNFRMFAEKQDEMLDNLERRQANWNAGPAPTEELLSDLNLRSSPLVWDAIVTRAVARHLVAADVVSLN